MQLARCPVCHSRISLEQLIQDEAGRDLLGQVAKFPDFLAAPCVSYIGLFRSHTRDLANDRALRLIREVLELHTDHTVLAAALAETVDALRIKQDEGNFKPLGNHNYLKRVIESVAVRPASHAVSNAPTSIIATDKPLSKVAQGVELLKAYPTPEEVPEWFTRTVCDSLAELLIMSLDSTPAFDTISLVAQRWIDGLWPKRDWKRDCRFRGAQRLHNAIISQAESNKRWPTVKDVLSHIPRV